MGKTRQQAYLAAGEKRKGVCHKAGCCCCLYCVENPCCIPRPKLKSETKKALQTLVPSGTGMIGAFATNEALQCLFKEAFGVSSEWILQLLYAIGVTIIACFAVTFLHRRGRSGSCCMGKMSSEDAHALAGMFKVAFALVCATAWNRFFVNTVKRCCKGVVLLVYALIMTVIGFLALWGARFAWHKLRSKQIIPNKNKACSILDKMIKYLLCGLALLSPLLFAFLCGAAWNDAFQAIITEIVGKDGHMALIRWAYALFVTPVAVLVTWIVSVSSDKGCCGAPEYLAGPLAAMFEGEMAAIVAFAYNDAVQATWLAMFGTEDVKNPEPVTKNVGIQFVYAVLITPLMLLLVLWSQKISDESPTQAVSTRQVASSHNLTDVEQAQGESKKAMYYEKAKRTCFKIRLPEKMREILGTLIEYTALIIFAIAWNTACQSAFGKLSKPALKLLFKFLYALIMIVAAFIMAAVAGTEVSFGEDIASW
eukprot:TRINITY_DN26672_c0_g1_i1.p1 TRINITY_DN26672_c0_g1~~TRINITY_DN26672_c0_g1_i1.p1  ORF type:complete len:505 (-),score=13.48 TRINITY_DN26672_c0_g1_i1:75-1514(-)